MLILRITLGKKIAFFCLPEVFCGPKICQKFVLERGRWGSSRCFSKTSSRLETPLVRLHPTQRLRRFDRRAFDRCSPCTCASRPSWWKIKRWTFFLGHSVLRTTCDSCKPNEMQKVYFFWKTQNLAMLLIYVGVYFYVYGFCTVGQSCPVEFFNVSGSSPKRTQ